MGSLLGLVVPLALGAAVSPTLVALQLVTLARRTAPLTRAWAVAAGSAVVLAGFSVLAFGVAQGRARSHTSEAGAIVKLAAALVLAGLGTRALLRPPRPAQAKRTGPHPHREAFALGAVLMLTNFSTIALFFPAIHAIGIAHVPVDGKVVAFVLVYAITLLPVVGPPLAVTILGPRATPALHALNRFFTVHQRAISAGICFIFAGVLGFAGLHALIG